MAEDDTANEDVEKQNVETEESVKKRSPIVILTWTILLLSSVFFYWHVMADRHTPYTDLARVGEIYIPITPRVSGYLQKVNVKLHSHVEQDEILFEIDPRPYLLAVKQAEANFDNTAQQVGAQSAGVKSAASSVGVANAQLDRAQRNYDRVMRIHEKNPGAMSQSDIDRVETSLDQAVEKLASSEAKLEKAKTELGVTGMDNPQLRMALNQLQTAQLDLEFTKIYAMFDGYVESFNVDVGYYCNAGQAIATFVSSESKWIQADLKENNLSHIEIGDSVNYFLDVAPGRIFSGKIISIGYGVNSGNTTNKGELPSVNSSSTWLRDPQRIPVIIEISDPEAFKLCRNGGQVDVVVFSDDNKWLNKIGNLQIWVNSKLSYIR